jgi:sterol desaturase/sphingolipid hydroxylase (fatty acid hydroxylase superfamily)
MNIASACVAMVFLFFAASEVVLGRFFHKDKTDRGDVILDLGSNILVPAVIVPLVLTASHTLAEAAFPGSEGMLSDWPWWAMFGVLLVADDMTQYWWHRLSHSSWLYPLHRAHHSAGYMSVRMVYRNNLIYYEMMPGLWFSGVLVYWGFLPVYLVYLVIKMTVIIGAHSSVPWDEKLLRWRWAHPLMWVVERVISTPTTHAVHHGLHEADGATWYKGNFGNLLFLWDVIFGTAKITRRRPESFGIEDMAPATWFEELVWPFKQLRDGFSRSVRRRHERP